ncbi:hypothetical protein HY417_01280 [Candidatus Kaiserbacteria bacterium]|nr:hypothetical protein [Candidatus Kaiserbacteria bacterium]
MERAIQEAQANPNAKEAAERFGKGDPAQAIEEVIRLTEEGLAKGSNVDAERQYLRGALRDCGVNGTTADLFAQAFFEDLKAA